MARYDYASRNTGYKPFGRTDQPVLYGGGTISYSASQTSQMYVASTEQVVEYGRFPATTLDHKHNPSTEQVVGYPRFPATHVQDQKHSPTRTEMVHRNHGLGEHHPQRPNRLILVPWSSARDQPEKPRQHSPGVGRNQAVHDQSKENNVRRGNSPPSRDNGKYKNYSSVEEHDDDDDYVCVEDGVCYNNNNKGGPNPNHDHQKHNAGNGYGTPPNTNYVIPTISPPQTRTDPSYIGTNNYDQGHKGNNGYSPSSYTVASHVTAQPRKDCAYYETPHINPNDHNSSDQKHKGNDYNSPPSRTLSNFTTQQKRDPYYSSNDQTSNRGSPLNSPPPLIRTRTDAIRRGGDDFSPEKGKNNSPVSGVSRFSEFSSPPRKQEETIDSEEARRRYGGAAVGGRNKAAEEKDKGPIYDSRDAARLFNGVFVSNSRDAPRV